MRHESLWQENTAEQSGLVVPMLTQLTVNLALVHNSVSLVGGRRVTNASNQPAVDTTVTVRLFGNGEELAPAWTRTYDSELLDGTDAYRDDFTDFVPAVPYLRALNEAHPEMIEVTVSRMWVADVHLTMPIQALAFNEWFNAPIFYDSLAAFVQPNTSAARSVLSDAAKLLRTNTGDSSLEGYQNGPERAALIAGAICASLRAGGIRYINPAVYPVRSHPLARLSPEAARTSPDTTQRIDSILPALNSVNRWYEGLLPSMLKAGKFRWCYTDCSHLSTPTPRPDRSRLRRARALSVVEVRAIGPASSTKRTKNRSRDSSVRFKCVAGRKPRRRAG